MSFTNLGLSPSILKAVAEKGYSQPSPVQAKAIPAVLEGSDLMAAAQTGTGKTAGFTLPILELLSRRENAGSNQVRALILTPTRELAAQVGESVQNYGKYLSLRSAVVFGGVKINPQMMNLRKGVDILVATPGRLLDLHSQNAVRFDQLEILVLDEADRMLDMGFITDIRKILRLLPKKRQNLMFSATFSDEIRELAKSIVNKPIEVSVSPRNTTVEAIEQWVYPVDKKQKADLLIHLINENSWYQALVFSRTKHGANKLVSQLQKADINAAAIHGNKSQGARTKALSDFKLGKLRVLVATDIAARGLDINQMPQVVNFDLPNVPEDYVHRIGRTGRAGASGHAISLVCADEIKQLSDIERLIKKTISRKLIDGFEPVHDLPRSNTGRSSSGRSNSGRSNSGRPQTGEHKKPFKAKKPKQGSSAGNQSHRSSEKPKSSNSTDGKPATKHKRSAPKKAGPNKFKGPKKATSGNSRGNSGKNAR